MRELRVEPDAVPDDRAADRRVVQPGPVELREIRGAGHLVRPLQPGAGAAREKGSAELVGSFSRDQVHADAAQPRLGAVPGDLDGHLLHCAVRDRAEHLPPAPGKGVADVHAVDVRLPVLRAAAVNVEGRDGLDRGAARVLVEARAERRRRVHPGHQQRVALMRLACRDLVDDLPIDERPLQGVLDVHDRARAGNRDGFLDIAHRQFHVDACREPGGELDALADQRAEPGQRVGDRVRARLEGHDQVLAGAVGHGRADLLDDVRASDFDGYAGQHAAGRIRHRAADLLRMGRAGAKKNACDDRTHDQRGSEMKHQVPLPNGCNSRTGGFYTKETGSGGYGSIAAVW